MTALHGSDQRSISSAGAGIASEIPPLPFAPIARTDIYADIDTVTRSCNGRVLLISAPAGSGKTVLLTDWAARRSSHPKCEREVAWLTITERLSDPAALWTAVSKRFRIATPPRRPGPATADPAHLIDALTARTSPAVLVLDDAHLISDPLALAGLEYFLHHAPPALTTVLCARFAPPIRWHVLDLPSRLTRWGSSELAFTPDQVRALCGDHGCELTDAELDTVVALTRGWAALVRIAAIHLAAYPDDHAAALTVLARPPHAVSDFLVGELVDALPPTLRQFLTYTSVPVSFTEKLADELVGGGAGHCLYELDRISFPIVSVVRDNAVWFTYHPMLRAYFLAQTDRLGPELRSDLQMRSAQWLRAAGLPRDALPHLLAGPDQRHLGEFLSECALTMILDGTGDALFDALAQAAPALLDDPFLWLVRVVDALVRGNTAAAIACLDTATARRATKKSFAPADRVEALALAVAVDAAVTGGTVIGELPHTVEPIGEPDFDAYTSIQLATALIARGAVARGEELLQSSLVLAEHVCHPRLVLHALTRLAFAASAVDSACAMRDRAARALAVAAEQGLLEAADAVQASTIAAYGAYLHGEEPDPAQVADALAVHVGHDGSTSPVAGWHGNVIGHLLALERADDQGAAADALRRNLLLMLETKTLPNATGSLVPPVVWALLRVQEAGTAHLLVERSRGVVGDLPDIRLADAALTYAANRPKATCARLEPLLDGSAALHPVTEITGWLMYATAQHDSGAPSKTVAALDNALRAAAPQRLVRPFLDVPTAIPLLDRYVGRFGRDERFADLVRRHPAARRRTTYPALTHTEMTVLKRLPSGRTAQQIAADLGVSVNTVKTHLRGIYAKLGANSRIDALDNARRSGLL
ncbi:LuxR C-terminal-related transcriptional regulator [Nocardia sp. NBC_00881]|uniref:LuxR C-terminal-related transcriptional regulator n=1 Tax=Nocardia sp. NBC_00881 TaxID=2975995 RepID=UPI003869C425|nr:LuxR C-terminal-related transcriptional regulator [Nocardia sp. NBC_00881]